MWHLFRIAVAFTIFNDPSVDENSTAEHGNSMNSAFCKDARDEADAILLIFGDRSPDVIRQRICIALDAGRYAEAMFWVDVQSLIYSSLPAQTIVRRDKEF
jgi:hypothetical protein